MDIVQQRPGLLLKQLCFLGWKCPVFLQVQLWYLSINFLQILGTATAVLPFSPEHPLPPALPHLQLVSLRAPWAAAASPSVLSSVRAVKPRRTQEWKREKPVAQEGCSGRTRLSCTWRSGGEPRVGSWGCQEGNELPGGFCWRLGEEKQGRGGGGGSCSHQKQQTLRLSSQSLCCR